MTNEELTKKIEILQEAFNKMLKRQCYLEDRLEKIDGVKRKRPSMNFDNGLPIA